MQIWMLKWVIICVLLFFCLLPCKHVHKDLLYLVFIISCVSLSKWTAEWFFSKCIAKWSVLLSVSVEVNSSPTADLMLQLIHFNVTAQPRRMSALCHAHEATAEHMDTDAVPSSYIMISVTLLSAMPHRHQSETHSKPSKMHSTKAWDRYILHLCYFLKPPLQTHRAAIEE